MKKNAVSSGHRALTLRILRSSPTEGVAPHWQDFHLEEAEGMTLFIALNEVRETLDPALQFDFVCRAVSAAAAACSSMASPAWPVAA